MEYFEKTVSSEEKYRGVIVNVRLDRAELCDGSVVRREVVEHPGGVTILPVDENGVCYMVRQFRYPMGRMMLEAQASWKMARITGNAPCGSFQRRPDLPPTGWCIWGPAAPPPAFPRRFCIYIWLWACTRAKATPTRASF